MMFRVLINELFDTYKLNQRLIDLKIKDIKQFDRATEKVVRKIVVLT